MDKVVVKASGEREPFNPDKVHESMVRAGASSRVASQALKDVERQTGARAKTEEIYQCSIRALEKKDPASAARYSLKRAIMELGPAGYVFEQYIGRLLEGYGYETSVGSVVRGHCVSHEIDVDARKGSAHFLIECKYHNRRGIRSDVKVAMYTYSRFLDVEAGLKKHGNHRKEKFHQAWIVTNTRATRDAERYAKCVGMKVIGWRTPRANSLEKLIERKQLYPVTILPTLSRQSLKALAQANIVLAEDVLNYEVKELTALFGMKRNVAEKVYDEANTLCG